MDLAFSHHLRRQTHMNSAANARLHSWSFSFCVHSASDPLFPRLHRDCFVLSPPSLPWIRWMERGATMFSAVLSPLDGSTNVVRWTIDRFVAIRRSQAPDDFLRSHCGRGHWVFVRFHTSGPVARRSSSFHSGISTSCAVSLADRLLTPVRLYPWCRR